MIAASMVRPLAKLFTMIGTSPVWISVTSFSASNPRRANNNRVVQSLTVPKRVGNAVVRNRIKRVLRELVRLEMKGLEGSCLSGAILPG